MATVGEQARADADAVQKKITKQWQNFSKGTGREAYADLMTYIDSLRAMYLKYAEDQAMPHPIKDGEIVSLSNDMIASLLQASRGCGMVKTYIQSRVDSDVAQSTK